MLTGQIKAVGALIAAAAVAGAFVWTYRLGVEHEANRRDAEALRVRLVEEALKQTIAQGFAGIEVKHVTVRQTLEKEIHEKAVYRDCVHSPDGLQLVNEALTGSVLADRQLPAAGAAD